MFQSFLSMKCKTSSVVSEVDIKFKKKAGMDPEHLFSVFSLLDDLYFKMSQDKTDSILVEYVTVPSLSLKNLVWTIWAFHPSFAFHAFFCTVVCPCLSLKIRIVQTN